MHGGPCQAQEEKKRKEFDYGRGDDVERPGGDCGIALICMSK